MHHSPIDSEFWSAEPLVPEANRQSLIGNQWYLYLYQPAFPRQSALTWLPYNASLRGYLRQWIQSFPGRLPVDNGASTPGPSVPLYHKQTSRHVGDTYPIHPLQYALIFYKVFHW